MEKILIKNGRLWDGEQFFFADLLVEGGRIAGIGESLTGGAGFVFDAKGKTVSAGLVDLHVHLKGISSDRYGIQAEMSSLPFGVTAANDGGGTQGDRALLDSFGVKNTVFVSTGIRGNRAELAAAEALLRKYGDKAIGLKVYFDTEVSEVRDLAPLKEVCAYAVKKGLKVMVHCSNSPVSMSEIVGVLSAGDILTHVYHGGANPCHENAYQAFRLAKQKGVVMDAGFAGYVHTDFKNLQAAVKAGFLPDTVSTDITCCSAYRRGGRYGMTMCMNMARHCGMREEELFRAVTSTPARVLGKAEEWGYLKVGRAADIAVFEDASEGFDLTDREGNRIQSEKGYRCVLTVLDGQVVYRD